MFNLLFSVWFLVFLSSLVCASSLQFHVHKGEVTSTTSVPNSGMTFIKYRYYGPKVACTSNAFHAVLKRADACISLSGREDSFHMSTVDVEKSTIRYRERCDSTCTKCLLDSNHAVSFNSCNPWVRNGTLMHSFTVDYGPILEHEFPSMLWRMSYATTKKHEKEPVCLADEIGFMRGEVLNTCYKDTLLNEYVIAQCNQTNWNHQVFMARSLEDTCEHVRFKDAGLIDQCQYGPYDPVQMYYCGKL